jgi:hypothetical protein
MSDTYSQLIDLLDDDIQPKPIKPQVRNTAVIKETGALSSVGKPQVPIAGKSESPKNSYQAKPKPGPSVSQRLDGLPNETALKELQSKKSKTMSMITRLNNLSSPLPHVERTNARVTKYSTWLEPGLEEEIEFCAFANDVRKYDVVIAAVKQFLKIK